jgi:hypothetical protein
MIGLVGPANQIYLPTKPKDPIDAVRPCPGLSVSYSRLRCVRV